MGVKVMTLSLWEISHSYSWSAEALLLPEGLWLLDTTLLPCPALNTYYQGKALAVTALNIAPSE